MSGFIVDYSGTLPAGGNDTEEGFFSNLMSGMRQTGEAGEASIVGAGASLASLIGMEDLSATLNAERIRQDSDTLEHNPRITDVRDAVDSFDNFRDYIGYALGSTIASGAQFAPAVAAGALAPAASAVAVGTGITAGLTALMGMGSTYSDLLDQGIDAPVASLVSGLGQGVVGSIIPHKLLGQVYWKAGARKAALGLTKVALGEGITEGAEEVIGGLGVTAAGGEGGIDDPEIVARILNAGVLGGIGGAAMGAGAGAFAAPDTSGARPEQAFDLSPYNQALRSPAMNTAAVEGIYDDAIKIISDADQVTPEQVLADIQKDTKEFQEGIEIESADGSKTETVPVPPDAVKDIEATLESQIPEGLIPVEGEEKAYSYAPQDSPAEFAIMDENADGTWNVEFQSGISNTLQVENLATAKAAIEATWASIQGNERTIAAGPRQEGLDLEAENKIYEDNSPFYQRWAAKISQKSLRTLIAEGKYFPPELRSLFEGEDLDKSLSEVYHTLDKRVQQEFSFAGWYQDTTGNVYNGTAGHHQFHAEAAAGQSDIFMQSLDDTGTLDFLAKEGKLELKRLMREDVTKANIFDTNIKGLNNLVTKFGWFIPQLPQFFNENKNRAATKETIVNTSHPLLMMLNNLGKKGQNEAMRLAMASDRMTEKEGVNHRMAVDRNDNALLDMGKSYKDMNGKLTPELKKLIDKVKPSKEVLEFFLEYHNWRQTNSLTAMQAFINDKLATLGPGPEFEAVKKEFIEHQADTTRVSRLRHIRRGRQEVRFKIAADTVFEGNRYDGKANSYIMEAFESKRERTRRVKEVEKKLGRKVKTELETRDDATEFYARAPDRLALEVAKRHGVDEAGLSKLRRAIAESNPNGFFASQQKRRGIAGFSQDFADIISAEAQTMGGVISGLMHDGKQEALIASTMNDAKNSATSTQMKEALGMSAQQMREIQKFEQTPSHWMGSIRGMMYHYFFSYNPKAALMNATQVPFIGIPWVQGSLKNVSFSDSRTLIKEAANSINVGSIRILSPSSKLQKSKERKSIVDLAEGELNQLDSTLAQGGYTNTSFAEERMAYHQTSSLGRLNYGTGIQGLTRQGKAILDDAVEAGSHGFKTVEEGNRRYMGRYAYLMGRKSGMNAAEATTFAMRAITETMFEYGGFNKARVMRNPTVNTALMFRSYSINVANLMFTGPAKKRMLGTMLAVAGLKGIPLADELMDLIDAGGTVLKNIYGDGGKFDSEKSIREIWAKGVQEFLPAFADPDFMMNGIAGVGGMAKSLQVQSVTGLGPVAKALAESYAGDQEAGQRAADSLIEALTGVAGREGVSLFRALADNSADSRSWLQKVGPSVSKNVTKAVSQAKHLEAYDSRGNRIMRFDQNDPWHMAGVLGQITGITPPNLQRQQEADWAFREEMRYFNAWRDKLYTEFSVAKGSRDPEALADVMKEVRNHNKLVPQSMILSNADLVKSYKQRQSNRHLRDLGLPQAKMYLPLRQRMVQSGAYPALER